MSVAPVSRQAATLPPLLLPSGPLKRSELDSGALKKQGGKAPQSHELLQAEIERVRAAPEMLELARHASVVVQGIANAQGADGERGNACVNATLELQEVQFMAAELIQRRSEFLEAVRLCGDSLPCHPCVRRSTGPGGEEEAVFYFPPPGSDEHKQLYACNVDAAIESNVSALCLMEPNEYMPPSRQFLGIEAVEAHVRDEREVFGSAMQLARKMGATSDEARDIVLGAADRRLLCTKMEKVAIPKRPAVIRAIDEMFEYFAPGGRSDSLGVHMPAYQRAPWARHFRLSREMLLARARLKGGPLVAFLRDKSGDECAALMESEEDAASGTEACRHYWTALRKLYLKRHERVARAEDGEEEAPAAAPAAATAAAPAEMLQRWDGASGISREQKLQSYVHTLVALEGTDADCNAWWGASVSNFETLCALRNSMRWALDSSVASLFRAAPPRRGASEPAGMREEYTRQGAFTMDARERTVESIKELLRGSESVAGAAQVQAAPAVHAPPPVGARLDLDRDGPSFRMDTDSLLRRPGVRLETSSLFRENNNLEIDDAAQNVDVAGLERLGVILENVELNIIGPAYALLSGSSEVTRNGQRFPIKTELTRLLTEKRAGTENPTEVAETVENALRLRNVRKSYSTARNQLLRYLKVLRDREGAERATAQADRVAATLEDSAWEAHSTVLGWLLDVTGAGLADGNAGAEELGNIIENMRNGASFNYYAEKARVYYQNDLKEETGKLKDFATGVVPGDFDLLVDRLKHDVNQLDESLSGKLELEQLKRAKTQLSRTKDAWLGEAQGPIRRLLAHCQAAATGMLGTAGILAEVFAHGMIWMLPEIIPTFISGLAVASDSLSFEDKALLVLSSSWRACSDLRRMLKIDRRVEDLTAYIPDRIAGKAVRDTVVAIWKEWPSLLALIATMTDETMLSGLEDLYDFAVLGNLEEFIQSDKWGPEELGSEGWGAAAWRYVEWASGTAASAKLRQQTIFLSSLKAACFYGAKTRIGLAIYNTFGTGVIGVGAAQRSSAFVLPFMASALALSASVLVGGTRSTAMDSLQVTLEQYVGRFWPVQMLLTILASMPKKDRAETVKSALEFRALSAVAFLNMASNSGVLESVLRSMGMTPVREQLQQATRGSLFPSMWNFVNDKFYGTLPAGSETAGSETAGSETAGSEPPPQELGWIVGMAALYTLLFVAIKRMLSQKQRGSDRSLADANSSYQSDMSDLLRMLSASTALA